MISEIKLIKKMQKVLEQLKMDEDVLTQKERFLTREIHNHNDAISRIYTEREAIEEARQEVRQRIKVVTAALEYAETLQKEN